jgi:hypothetical protein
MKQIKRSLVAQRLISGLIFGLDVGPSLRLAGKRPSGGEYLAAE